MCALLKTNYLVLVCCTRLLGRLCGRSSGTGGRRVSGAVTLEGPGVGNLAFAYYR